MPGRVSSPVFVGRRHQLERVDAAVEAARESRSAVLVVAGEAGVGKTRFAREVESRARASGARVLEGGCIQVGVHGLPFGPLIEALRTLASELEATELDFIVGSGRAVLAGFIPALQSEGGEAGAPPTIEGVSQGRLFEHLLLLLQRLARNVPVLMVIEDIHWADRSTLDFLSFLARNLHTARVVVLATYRSDDLHRRHPLLPFLGELERRPGVERIELVRFDRSELMEQVGAILGDEADDELVESLLARSQGNPFYAEELVAAGSATRLPETLRDVLLAHVATLSEPTQTMLQVAAAAGARISPTLVADALGTTEEALDAAFDEALARHVLINKGLGRWVQFAFRHALLQEAVYDDLLPGRRTRLHAAFARALSAREASPVDASWAAEVAYHWDAARDMPRAFDAWIRAGLAAEQIYAVTEELASFDHVLDLWDQIPNADERAPFDRAEILSRAARAAWVSNPGRAVAYIREAIELVDSAANPARAGLLQERLGTYSWSAADPGTSLTAFREAVRLVPEQPASAARALALAGLGRYLAMTDHPAESALLCEEALSVARAAGARAVESRALRSLGLDLVLLGDVDGGRATLRQAHDVSLEVGDVETTAGALYQLTEALAFAGRTHETIAAGLEAEAYAARHGLGGRAGALAILVTASSLESLGRWDEAASTLARALQYDVDGLIAFDIETRTLSLEVRRGQFAAAAGRAQRLRRRTEEFRDLRTMPTLAELALWQGDPLAARETIRDAVAAFDRQRDRDQILVIWLERALALGLWAEADLAHRARLRHADADLVQSRAVGTDLLGRTRAAAEDSTLSHPNPGLEAAWLATSEAEFSRLEDTPQPDSWASAAIAWRALERPFEHAYALAREAEATLALHRDRPRAADRLRGAHSIAVGLGAAPLAEFIERLAARGAINLEPASEGVADGNHRAGWSTAASAAVERINPPTHAHRSRYDLTPREREVLGLLVAGYADGEIAQQLFITKKTASVHVARIKGKLGARSRVEIATDAISLGLIEAPPTPARI